VAVEKVYQLGRKCTLEIDGEPYDGVADVSVRERTETIDVTGFGHTVVSELPVTRTYQILVTFAEIRLARTLWSQRTTPAGSFLLPRIFEIQIDGAVININERFIIADIDDDQPIDGAILPRIQFNQWGHPAA
jgi:hypothetical protein